MCWVMPPCSPAATSVERSASSRDVLPWSTWPMTVTTAGRETRWSSTSSSPMKPTSTSLSDTRRTERPNSLATSSAVSLSITSLIFSISPWRIRNLMISTPRMAIRPASSCTVMTSGITTSRAPRVCSAWPPLRFSRSRSRARRTEASERMRSTASSSSPASAWMVRRPSRRFGSPLVRETALPSAGALPRLLSASSSKSGRRSRFRLPGRGAWRVARWISGPDGGGAGRPPAPGGRGPPGRPPPSGRGLGRGDSAE